MIFPDIQSGSKYICGEQQPEYNAVEDAQANIVEPSFEFGDHARPVWDQKL